LISPSPRRKQVFSQRSGGLVHTAIHGDRVYLTGRAVTVLDAALHHTA
jgi:hypothetical protein